MVIVMPKIQKKKNGQYVVTVNKGIGDGLDLEGAEADWNIKSRNTLELQVNNRPNGEEDDE